MAELYEKEVARLERYDVPSCLLLSPPPVLPACLPVCARVCRSTCLYACLPVYVTVCVSVPPLVCCMRACLSTCLCACWHCFEFLLTRLSFISRCFHFHDAPLAVAAAYPRCLHRCIATLKTHVWGGGQGEALAEALGGSRCPPCRTRNSFKVTPAHSGVHMIPRHVIFLSIAQGAYPKPETLWLSTSRPSLCRLAKRACSQPSGWF